MYRLKGCDSLKLIDFLKLKISKFKPLIPSHAFELDFVHRSYAFENWKIN